MPERHCKDARTHFPSGRHPGSAPAALGTVRPGDGQATLPETHSWVSGTSLLRRHLGPVGDCSLFQSLLTSLVSSGGTWAAKAPQDTKLTTQNPPEPPAPRDGPVVRHPVASPCPGAPQAVGCVLGIPKCHGAKQLENYLPYWHLLTTK